MLMPPADKKKLVSDLAHTVRCTSVIKTRFTNHAKAKVASNALCSANQCVRVPKGRDWHKIRNFRHSVFGKEPRQQHIGVRQIQLLLRSLFQFRSQKEFASVPMVQQRGKNRR